MVLRVPRSVFVPFEWNGHRWVKRDDLPRFKEPEEAAKYICDNAPQGILQWREHDEYALINEYLAGVGTPEWSTRKH